MDKKWSRILQDAPLPRIGFPPRKRRNYIILEKNKGKFCESDACVTPPANKINVHTTRRKRSQTSGSDRAAAGEGSEEEGEGQEGTQNFDSQTVQVLTRSALRLLPLKTGKG